MRVVRRIFLILFIVLAVVIGAAAVYANSTAAKRQLRAFILRELNDTYGIPTEFDELEVRFFPLSVTVYGLRVSHPTEGPFLEARALTITPELWSVLRGKYRFEEIALLEPHLHLKLRDGRLVNLPQPRRQEGPDVSTPLVDAFAAVDGRIELSIETTGEPPVAVNLAGVNLDVTGSRNELFELRALVSGGNVRWGDFTRPVTQFEARVGATLGEVRLRRLAFELGDDVKVKVYRGLLRWGANPEVHVSGQAALPLPLLDLLPRSLGLPSFGGSAQVVGQVDYGPPAQPGAAADATPRWSSRVAVTLIDARAGRYVVGDVGGTVRVGSDGLRAEGLLLDTGIGKITIDGSFRFDQPGLPIDALVRMERLEFAPLLERFGVERSKAVQTFDGTIAVQGTASPFHIVARLDTDVTDFAVFNTSFRFDEKVTIVSVPKAHATGGIETDLEQLTLIPTHAITGESKHLVTGSYRYGDEHFVLDIVSTPLVTADISELLEIGISGTGPAHTLLDGPMGDLKITAEMSFRDFRYLEKSFGNVHATLLYEDDVLSFPEIRAVQGESRYAVVPMTFDFRDERPERWTATAEVQAEAVRVRDVATVLRDDPARWAPFDGFAEGTVHILYRSWLDEFEVGFDGRAKRVTVYGEPLDLVAAAGRYRNGSMQVPHFRAERLGGWVEGSATIGFQGPRLKAEFDGAGIPVHQLFGGALQQVGLEALASIHGSVDGPLAALEGSATVQLAGTKVRGFDLGDVALDATLASGLRLRLTGATADGDLAFDALAELSGRQRVGVAADFRDLQPFLFLDDPRLDGWALRVSGRTALVLTLGRELQVDGKADFTDFALSTPQGTVRAVEPVWIAFTDSSIEFRRGRFEAPGGTSFTLLGDFGADRLDLDVHGTADLALVLGLLPTTLPEATGKLEFGARVTGTLDEPLLVGTAHLRDGRLVVGEPFGEVTNIDAELTLTPSQISVDRCAAEFLGGNVRVNGSVALARFEPQGYDLGLDFGGLTYQLTPTLPVAFDGTLRVTGAQPDFRPLVRGDVYVTRLAYTDPIRLGVSLSSLGRPEIETIPTFRPEDDYVRFDVRLHGEGLLVRNNLIEATFHIDDATQPFRLVGTNQLFGLVGAVVIDHGQMRFRRSVFDVTRGVVTFDSPWKVDPRFDVVAETEVRDWRITLTASGRRNDLRLVTTSDPDLSEDDVVLLLTVGMTREEAELMGAGGAAAGALAEVFDEALGVSERVGRYVPIFDQMRLTTEYSPRTGRSEPRITIGKRISDQARIEASSALTDTRDFRAVFSYEVTDQLSLEGVYDNNNDQQFGNVGADVRWRIEF
jgi:translocation and assembly module TamB